MANCLPAAGATQSFLERQSAEREPQVRENLSDGLDCNECLGSLEEENLLPSRTSTSFQVGHSLYTVELLIFCKSPSY